ncbi:hypothetical protein K4K48_003257 [Colletotrichum sp. SAR 10_66]|nr:hypothetical protein K4K48_003257 [Colletotrichum sp. SAR 10_66]
MADASELPPDINRGPEILATCGSLVVIFAEMMVILPEVDATVAAVIKISFLPNYGKHGDFLFDSSDITIWTTVEICTAIIAASIPCLKPLFRAILAGSSAKYTSKYNNHDGYVRNNGTSRTGATGDPQGNIEMFSRSRRNTTAVRSGFNRSKMDSEESIVGTQRSVPPDGITKTTHVSVSVDDGQQRSPKDLV